MSELMNPFEATFDLLQSLRDEINELRRQLIQEQKERARETSELHQALLGIQHSKNSKFEEICNTVEELRLVKNARFDKLEAEVDELKERKNRLFDAVDQKLETEISQREASCYAIDKTITAEVALLQHFDRSIATEVQEHKKNSEMLLNGLEQKHEWLRLEVEKLAHVLRNNSMTRDPHKHFGARPGRSTTARNMNTTPLAPLDTPRQPASPPLTRTQFISDSNPQTPGDRATLPELTPPKKN